METVLFTITAIVAVVCAVAMIASRNAVHSALFLVVNFSAVAVLYLLLRAPFLAAVQVTVYAGAIMVLFLFVIMLLGVERGEGAQERYGWLKPLAGLLIVLLVGEGAYIAFNSEQLLEVAPVEEAARIGAPEALSLTLFERYLLPFEITSVLLLVAIIGAVVLTRRQREETR